VLVVVVLVGLLEVDANVDHTPVLVAVGVVHDDSGGVSCVVWFVVVVVVLCCYHPHPALARQMGVAADGWVGPLWEEATNARNGW
jgi:hypothetical protein